MHKFNIKNIEKLDNPKRRTEMPPEEILKRFKIEDSGNFLDIGCGIGYFTIPAAEFIQTNKVIGIDIIQEMINISKTRSNEIKNIEFKLSDEYNFPIENDSITYAFISNVLHEIEDKIEYISEIKRVLKSEGYLCIIEWEKKLTESGPPLEERLCKEELKNLFKLYDLNLVEEVYVNTSHYGLKFKLHK